MRARNVTVTDTLNVLRKVIYLPNVKNLLYAAIVRWGLIQYSVGSKKLQIIIDISGSTPNMNTNNTGGMTSKLNKPPPFDFPILPFIHYFAQYAPRVNNILLY